MKSSDLSPPVPTYPGDQWEHVGGGTGSDLSPPVPTHIQRGQVTGDRSQPTRPPRPRWDHTEAEAPA